jgi:phosphoribosyl-ATP pyrophosphohydrolase
MFKNLEELITIIRKRKQKPIENSYTNKLLSNRKLNIEKIREEMEELIEAVEKNTNKVHESADILYHLLVFLEGNGVKIEDVMIELERRKKNQ